MWLRQFHKFFEESINWAVNEKRPAHKIVKSLILLVPVVLLTHINAVVAGAAILNFPNICSLLVVLGIVVTPCLFLLFLLKLILGKSNIRLLVTGLIFAILVCLLEFGIGTLSRFAAYGLPESLRSHLFRNTLEFPIGQIDTIAVDNSGHIYLGTDYNRIQKYDTDGRFLRGWFVNTSGRFNLHTHDDEVHAITARQQRRIIFDSNGTLLEEMPISDYKFLIKTESSKAKGIDGSLYYADNRFWSARVIKKSPDGYESVIIKSPDNLWLFVSPAVPFLLGAILALISGAMLKHKHFENRELVL